MIVQGRLKARTWETREGEKRTSFEIDVDEIGPSLQLATAKVTRASRSGGGGGYGGGAPAAAAATSGGRARPRPVGHRRPAGRRRAGRRRAAAGNDPWGAPGVGNDEPPF